MTSHKKALLTALLFLSLDAAADVPKAISVRANEIARTYGGPNYQVTSIQKLPNVGELKNATQVMFTDSLGSPVSFVMLNDGKHIIKGTLEVWDPSLQPAADKLYAPPSAVSRSSLYGEFQEDDFTPSGLSQLMTANTAPDQSAVDFYLSILSRSAYINDGSAGPIVYSLIDPSCPACANEYSLLRDLIDAQKITVRWVPVLTVSRAPYGKLLSLFDPLYSNEEKVDLIGVYFNKGAAVPLRSDSASLMDSLRRNQSLLEVVALSEGADTPTGTPLTLLPETKQGPVLIRKSFSTLPRVIMQYLAP